MLPPDCDCRLRDSMRSKSAVLLRSTAAPMLEKLADGLGSELVELSVVAAAEDSACGAAVAAVAAAVAAAAAAADAAA